MKHQALFSLKDKKKNLLQFYLAPKGLKQLKSLTALSVVSFEREPNRTANNVDPDQARG